MRLPRRVPWASIAELDKVCAWIYNAEADYSTKTQAVHRLAAWRAITSLPHALESTLAFLVVILQDKGDVGSSISAYSLRQGYATAVIRFVNGLVDPLQSGPYARSIGSIAAQIGLPSWFVDLRHAATHEDLPSLEVLREATSESLGWLLHNYFLPVLNPASVDQTNIQPMRPVSPLLKQYKALSKIISRDVSLRSRYQGEVTKVLRDIERWISEAKVAANAVGGTFGWDVETAEESDGKNRPVDVKERIALEGLCDALLDKGSLVPLSKRKRSLAKGSFTLPQALLSIWTPLLSHVQSLHPTFHSVLVSHIVSRLLFDPSTRSQPYVPDHSYEMCLASWVVFLLRTSDAEENSSSDSEVLSARNVVVSLLNDLGPMLDNVAADRQTAKALLKELCRDNPQLEETCTQIASKSHLQTQSWQDDYLSVLTGRLNEMLAHLEEVPGKDSPTGIDPVPSSVMSTSGITLPRGWRHVDASNGWKLSPIGVFVPCV